MKRKILAFALVFMMLFAAAPAMTAGAENIQFPGTGTGTGTITINNPNTNLAIIGETFEIYQIFSLTYNATQGSYNYTLNSAFNDFAAPVLGIYNGAEFKTFLENKTGKTDLTASDLIELTAALKNFVGNGTNFTAVRGVYTIDSSTPYVISNLPLGYYMVLGGGLNENGEAGSNYVTALANLTTTDTDSTVIVKADVPTINKEVWNHNLTATDKWDTWADVNIGDTVDFRITSTVPNMRGYKTYKFTVHDTMSESLTFEPNSVKVYIDSIENTTAGLYTVVNPTTHGDTFDIVFDPVKFKALTTGQSIEITYSATLNEKAKIGNITENMNEAQLEYSNNPYDSTKTGKTHKPQVNVYTFDIDIYKYTGDITNSANALAGAKFVLSVDENGTNPINLYKIDDNTYRVTKAISGNGVYGYFITPDDGKVTVIGLDAGIYYLNETEAPTGYNKIAAPIKVEIGHFLDNGKGTGQYTINNIAGNPDTKPVPAEGNAWVAVINNKGIQFPETGGIGRTIFYIAGSLIALGSIIGLAVYLKLSSKKEKETAK